MGCILSFFILCIINFATVVVAFEEKKGRQLTVPELRALPVRINGDDIAFRACPSVIARWKTLAKAVGLKPSLGKNFVSQEFIMINSEMYLYSRDWTRHIHGYGVDEVEDLSNHPDPSKYFRRIIKFSPYLNLGLLRGQGRVQEDTRVDQKFINGTDTYGAVGPRARALVRGFSERKSRKLISMFLEHNMKTLKSTSRSWNIPEELGGLGIPFLESEYSVKGSVVAAYLDRCDPEKYASWMSRIQASELNPPDFVKASLSVTSSVQKFFGHKAVWMSRDEAKKYEVPMITGLTFLTTPFRAVEKEDRKVSPEAAYERLYHEAIRSGVKSKTREQLDEVWGHKREDLVRAYRTSCDLQRQLSAWVPRIPSGFFTQDWAHPPNM